MCIRHIDLGQPDLFLANPFLASLALRLDTWGQSIPFQMFAQEISTSFLSFPTDNRNITNIRSSIIFVHIYPGQED